MIFRFPLKPCDDSFQFLYSKICHVYDTVHARYSVTCAACSIRPHYIKNRRNCDNFFSPFTVDTSASEELGVRLCYFYCISIPWSPYSTEEFHMCTHTVLLSHSKVNLDKMNSYDVLIWKLCWLIGLSQRE